MLSVRSRKRALWIAAGVSWGIAMLVCGLSLADPDVLHWRTLTLIALSIASTLFGCATIASLIQAPDVAYRIGVEHGRAGTCDRCRPQVMIGTDAVVLPFPRQHTDN